LFERVYSEIRKSLYGIRCYSTIEEIKQQNANGTAFMVAPTILATAAHTLHIRDQKHKKGKRHKTIEVFWALDPKRETLPVEVLAVDLVRDLALLKIDNPNSNDHVTLEINDVPIAAPCASLGFPFAESGLRSCAHPFRDFQERFQAGYVSSLYQKFHESGRYLLVYDIDILMYWGSSGTPVFLENGNVFGMFVESFTFESKKVPDYDERSTFSSCVPSSEIVAFANQNGIKIL